MSTTTEVPASRARARLPSQPTRYTPEEGEIAEEGPQQGPSDRHSIVGFGEAGNSSTQNRSRTPTPSGGAGKGKNRSDSNQRGELNPRDSISNVGSAAGLNVSSATKIRRKAYRKSLKRRMITQILRLEDEENHDTSNIEDAAIEFNNTHGWDRADPSVQLPIDEITWEEFEEMQKIFPVPAPKNLEQQRRDTPPHMVLRDNRGNRGGRRERYRSRRDRRNHSPPENPTERAVSPLVTDLNRGTGMRRGGGGGPPGRGPPDEDDSEDDSEPNNPRKESKAPPRGTGPSRYRSEDPSVDLNEVYEYNPMPRSEEEVLKASFRRYEQLIEFYLFGPPMNSLSAVQKALLQAIPKPSKYGGSADYGKFDDWTTELIQWLNVADQCRSPTRYSGTRGGYVLSSVDLTRTNTLGSFLEGEALRWFRLEVQRVPDRFANNPDPLAYRWTFMQVMNGLYQRFVHDASISQITDRFHLVTYSQPGGVKSLFSELKRWATCMPIPPDMYTFKKRILLLIPESMCDHLMKIEKISAERSLINNIMQAAIECERSIRTGKYYASARAATEQNQKLMREPRRNDAPVTTSRKTDSYIPKRLQVVENRRYQVTDHPTYRADQKKWDARFVKQNVHQNETDQTEEMLRLCR
ncbi:hypothetical protein DFJ43DRAFT_1155809 [Lentinula guzmanii]|uniref:Uncharacterized protein n=1 Tax=Lentinula guzmanii TaxID=2804957 RepID=A0AA38JE87_9AGAR|nr:hypothetical protein DFJ43DRAFT_1155809 [Lentinula guzmanii]